MYFHGPFNNMTLSLGCFSLHSLTVVEAVQVAEGEDIQMPGHDSFMRSLKPSHSLMLSPLLVIITLFVYQHQVTTCHFEAIACHA